MTLLAFDLDGTLLDADGADYEDPAQLIELVRPIPTAVARVVQLHARGWLIAYVTGRSRAVRAATVVNIRAAGLPAGELRMSRKWRGFDAMAHEKAAHLDALGAELYVGDHDADLRAADMAGTPFMHALDFQRGAPLPIEIREATAGRLVPRQVPAGRAIEDEAAQGSPP